MRFSYSACVSLSVVHHNHALRPSPLLSSPLCIFAYTLPLTTSLTFSCCASVCRILSCGRGVCSAPKSISGSSRQTGSFGRRTFWKSSMRTSASHPPPSTCVNGEDDTMSGQHVFRTFCVRCTTELHELGDHIKSSSTARAKQRQSPASSASYVLSSCFESGIFDIDTCRTHAADQDTYDPRMSFMIRMLSSPSNRKETYSY